MKKYNLILIFLSSFQVLAQTPPSPGDLGRQIAPSLAPILPKAYPDATRAPIPSLIGKGSDTVKVRQWVLEGNTLLPQSQIDGLLRPFTDVDVSVKQIQEAAAWIQRAYEDAGWVARISLPQQDVTDGVVRITVVEARLGSVLFVEGAATRVNPDVVDAIVNYPLTHGGPLNTQQVNRGLLLADDLMGVSVTGQLKGGKAEGTTDVVVLQLKEPATMFEVGIDNANARSVDEWRAVGSGMWLSPSGLGESYSFQTLKSAGAKYLRLGGSAPLGSSGLKGNLAIGQMYYKVVVESADGLVPDINGSAQNLVADIAYPLLRSKAQNLYVTTGLEQRDYKSFVNTNKENDYRVTAYSLGISGNHFDNFGIAGTNAYSLSIISGRVKMLDPNSGNDANTLGNYSKVRWTFSRQQALARGLTFFVGLQGQMTGNKPLDSSENMSLGGPNGVRAYPVAEATGAQGTVANLELRWSHSAQWLFTPFIDIGSIQKRSSDNLRAYNLKGTGISATWTGPDGWVGKSTLAHRIGRNPNPADGGKDQDGSLRKYRVWVSMNRSF